VREAVKLEITYAGDGPPQGTLGISSDLFCDCVEHIGARRLEGIGSPAQYGSGNPFPWMSVTIDLRKKTNFFHTRVTKYQSAGTSYGINPHTRQTGA
jgi:ribonucleoside-diphosphate reductase beta chain